MTSPIKPGDLVMVVKPVPCCGTEDRMGLTSTVQETPRWALYAQCRHCGEVDYAVENYRDLGDGAYHVDTLKKVDPPAEGDSLPTRADIEVPA